MEVNGGAVRWHSKFALTGPAAIVADQLEEEQQQADAGQSEDTQEGQEKDVAPEEEARNPTQAFFSWLEKVGWLLLLLLLFKLLLKLLFKLLFKLLLKFFFFFFFFLLLFLPLFLLLFFFAITTLCRLRNSVKMSKNALLLTILSCWTSTKREADP